MTFTVYSKKGCPYCEKFIAIIEYEELKHVVYELEKHFTKDQFIAEFGEDSTFPQIVVDGEKLGGCREAIEYLQENKIVA
jgi:glutaredoxin